MKYLIILPHPDDETYFASGLIGQLNRANKLDKTMNEIRIVILTKGGAGKNYLNSSKTNSNSENLEDIRTEEFRKVMKILEVENYKLYDFEDGKLRNTNEELRIKNAIIDEINTFNPDSVVTYDNTGVTGHPDHIAVSEIIYDLQKLDKYTFELLFITAGRFESKIYDHLENYKFRFEPNFIIKLSISDTITKMRALNIYKSQFPLSKRIQIFVKFIFDPREYFIKIYDHEPVFEFVEFEI